MGLSFVFALKLLYDIVPFLFFGKVSSSESKNQNKTTFFSLHDLPNKATHQRLPRGDIKLATANLSLRRLVLVNQSSFRNYSTKLVLVICIWVTQLNSIHFHMSFPYRWKGKKRKTNTGQVWDWKTVQTNLKQNWNGSKQRREHLQLCRIIL